MVLFQKNKENLIISAKDNIIVYNVNDQSDHNVKIPGPVIPNGLTKGQIETLNKEVRNITSIESSSNGDYIVVTTENKQVVVYDKQFNVLRNFIIPRAPSKAIFTPSNDILVSDKTGDVYLYRFGEEKGQPVLLLGHLSIILDVVITDCGKYIITCDRDEKIRVSCFPNAYNIVCFCLGHKEFVTKLKLVGEVLISASGDGTVRFWNYLRGEQVGIIYTNENVNPNLIEKFSKRMDAEKVDVTALPVTDIQVDQKEELILAVSVHTSKDILLYLIDLQTLTSNFLFKVSVSCNSILLLKDSLYLVLSDSLYILNVDSKKLESEYNLGELYKKYKHILTSSFDTDEVIVYYKRKFDNVQEYLERKKQRLETK